MPIRRRVYLLSSRDLPPETIAVTFAKTSRSPASFDAIARELSAEQSAAFHQKWVIGYGHASVAEHAVLHIAVEKVSRLALETLESARLASFTEQSTRYQKWHPEAFARPQELENHPLRGLYEATVRHLFAVYQDMLEPVQAALAARHDPQAGHRPPRATDICRFLLPAATLANVGMTVNARELAHTLRKMLAHPLAEVRDLAREIRDVALKATPTLLRYVAPDTALRQALERARHWRARWQETPSSNAAPETQDWMRLLAWDPEGELRVLAAVLYRVGSGPYSVWLERVRAMPPQAREALARDLLAHLGPHDVPLRELEHTFYTVEILLDQGAFYELKRHRMMALTPQPLTADLGYTVPRAVVEAGMERRYREAMERAGEAYHQLAAWNPHVAAYVVPNGYRRRVLVTLNARQAFHLIRLRSAKGAHFSMRRVALRLAELLREVHPALFAFLHLPETTWQAIEARNFALP